MFSMLYCSMRIIVQKKHPLAMKEPEDSNTFSMNVSVQYITQYVEELSKLYQLPGVAKLIRTTTPFANKACLLESMFSF